MSEASERTPRLARRARLARDAVRARDVVLMPESVVALTPSAAEVLRLCDGAATVGALVGALEQTHPGAPIARDVPTLLGRLAARGVVEGVEPVYESRGENQLVRTEARGPDVPLALLAELTYRCPLRCGYCSNPTDLGRYRDELSADEWARVFREGREAGVLQLHLSGGEPLVRDDLEAIVRAGRGEGLYTNLITSAWALTPARLDALVDAGVEHVQVSLQDTERDAADRIAGAKAHEHKLLAARWVHERGLALSINAVIHRGNVEHVGALVDLAAALSATRLELANAQYHGWALRNRDALLPSRAALERAFEAVEARRPALRGRMDVLFVLPDYYTDLPKPCMDGWGRRFVTVIPDGTVLPCPGAHALPLRFETVRDRSLGAIWRDGEAFNAFRGTAWMPEPCSSCERREVDHGGCRCQAFALTGDARATDPACSRAPAHAVVEQARRAADREAPAALYRVRTSKDAGPGRG